MSHTVKNEIDLKDTQVLEKTLHRLGVRSEQVENYTMFDGKKVSGLAIYLKGWRYPAVLTTNGELFYDNYNGSWGDITELNTLKQYYGVEKTKKLARVKGYSVTETTNKDGLPQVVINV